MTEKIVDSRYPYTYACDYIRALGPVSSEGVILSRSDASAIRHGIATALGIADEELAIKLADAQLKNEQSDEYLQEQVGRIVKAVFSSRAGLEDNDWFK